MNEGQRGRARSFIPSAEQPFSGASPSVAIPGMTVPIGGSACAGRGQIRSRRAESARAVALAIVQAVTRRMHG
jgi:hypothetical protein